MIVPPAENTPQFPRLLVKNRKKPRNQRTGVSKWGVFPPANYWSSPQSLSSRFLIHPLTSSKKSAHDVTPHEFSPTRGEKALLQNAGRPMASNVNKVPSPGRTGHLVSNANLLQLLWIHPKSKTLTSTIKAMPSCMRPRKPFMESNSLCCRTRHSRLKCLPFSVQSVANC